MKKILFMCLGLCLIISASVSAQQQQKSPQMNMYDFKGQNWVTGHLGYAFGMGSAFQTYSEPYSNIEYSNDAGIGFGGQYYYGLKHNLLIGGELMFQSYKYEVSYLPDLAAGYPGTSVSHTQTETNILANGLYAVNQTRNSALFLLGGTGFYDFGGMKLGLNTGIVWRTQISDKVHFFGMPRIHLVMTDNTPTMFQLTLGAQFSLGS